MPDDKLDKVASLTGKSEPYRTLPLSDYIQHTSQIEGGDPDFKTMFPKEKMPELQKRNEDFRKKYGEFAANREFWGDALSKTIGTRGFTIGSSIQKAAEVMNVDPKVLLGNAMEEGFYKTAYGKRDAYPGSIVGLEDLPKDYEKLKNYLPDYLKNKIELQEKNGRKVPVFKDPEDMLIALGGYLNMYKDKVEQYSNDNKLKLSPKALDFFTAAAYNSSKNTDIDNTKKMIQYYNSKGLLKNDKFLTEDNLAKDKYGSIYENARRRFDSVNGLYKEIESKKGELEKVASLNKSNQK